MAKIFRGRDIVRYRKGKTALMQIIKIEDDDFGKRLYGINIIGDQHAAYAHDCQFASEADLWTWDSYSTDRNACEVYSQTTIRRHEQDRGNG